MTSHGCITNKCEYSSAQLMAATHGGKKDIYVKTEELKSTLTTTENKITTFAEKQNADRGWLGPC